MLLLGSYRISWDCTLDLSSQCVKMSRFNDNSVLVMIITILFVTFQDIVNLSRVKRTKSGVPEQDKGCHLGSAQIFVRTSMARASEHNVNASARINKCWYDRVQECPTRISVTSLSQKRAFSAAIRISPRVQNEGSARCYRGHILELQFLVPPAHVAGAYLQDLPIKRECKLHMRFAVWPRLCWAITGNPA